MNAMKNIFLVFLLISISACGQSPKSKSISKIMTEEKKTTIDTATVGGGCFWCTEAQFQVLDGVISVQSGFSGGNIKNPSYKEVCMGTTGHAEVVQVVYDTTKLNYEDVLKAFFESHDPTTQSQSKAGQTLISPAIGRRRALHREWNRKERLLWPITRHL